MKNKLQREAVLIIGEGPTERFYLESLRDIFPSSWNIKVNQPKHGNNIQQLDTRIMEAAEMGYTKVFCMIDMDTKKEGTEHDKYIALKRKYANPIVKKRKGIDCEVRFYETERCTEQFFLYYFSETSRAFSSYHDLEKELKNHCDYEKTEKFFIKHPLHHYFESKGGSLDRAVRNAKASIEARNCGERNYSYSELGKMIEDLKEMFGII